MELSVDLLSPPYCSRHHEHGLALRGTGENSFDGCRVKQIALKKVYLMPPKLRKYGWLRDELPAVREEVVEAPLHTCGHGSRHEQSLGAEVMGQVVNRSKNHAKARWLIRVNLVEDHER